MPRIFDNLDAELLPALRETIKLSKQLDICVGYFSLSGWRLIDDLIESISNATGPSCRLLIGMNSFPRHITRSEKQTIDEEEEPLIDQGCAASLVNFMAEEFKNQLRNQLPTNSKESSLRKLADQLREGKVIIKLFLKHPLHAKLYLFKRDDAVNPLIGYLGSSNLSYSGLVKQGELNIDVLDHDASLKLSKWFDARWDERLSIDISDRLVDIIDNSWAQEELQSPYVVYIAIAYHLSKEARTGVSTYSIPKEFSNILFDYQAAAVKIAANHLMRRSGVLLGDVVGLGKTLIASAIAKIFQDETGNEILVLCPKNLTSMWEDYLDRYSISGRVLSFSMSHELENLKRFKVVVIDESHNLRNREGKRYKEIRKFLSESNAKCILLSATPYNRAYLDISSQLRLFLPEDFDLGIRPEKKISEIGEAELIRRTQASLRTLKAFEASDSVDDWRDLMRLFMVRRTRTFLQQHYAKTDEKNGNKYLSLADGTKSYFPKREPRTIKYETGATFGSQYNILFSAKSVQGLLSLKLPRYGLGFYINKKNNLNELESKLAATFSKSGRTFLGICRSSLFKRLESGGPAFLKSIKRHLSRNQLFLYAIVNNLDIPIGHSFNEVEMIDQSLDLDENPADFFEPRFVDPSSMDSAKETYESILKDRTVKWIKSSIFNSKLKEDLEHDVSFLSNIIEECGHWDAEKDTKIQKLLDLIVNIHGSEKIVVFSQYADTVDYIFKVLRSRGVEKLEKVTGASENPAETAWRFSPQSNGKSSFVNKKDEIRVLITTDVLSEGVNLQDSSIVVSYDLPWAIIRLVQRAGRVDRIGQKSEKVTCYSFLPAEGIERILGLRARVRSRLKENAEVIGTDELFFDDEISEQPFVDIYNEKSGVLDSDEAGDEAGDEVDLHSHAYQIWLNAIKSNPGIETLVTALAPVSYACKNADKNDASVIVYASNIGSLDSLVWVNKDGKLITTSQSKILEAAKCYPQTIPLVRGDDHHVRVADGLRIAVENGFTVGGQLGKASGARYKAYNRLSEYLSIRRKNPTLFDTKIKLNQLDEILEEIYKFPLKEGSEDILKKRFRDSISDEDFTDLIIILSTDGALCQKSHDNETGKPRIICSLGLQK